MPELSQAADTGQGKRVDDEIVCEFPLESSVDLSQQENGLVGADLATVASNFTQAQVANDSERDGAGAGIADSVGFSELNPHFIFE